MPSRRRFVRAACGAVVLTADLVTLGCGPTTVKNLGDDDDDDALSPVPTVTPNGNLVTMAIADYPALANVGGFAFAFVQTPPLTIIVARADETTFLALNGLCTHRNCYVSFVPATDDFNCACHGARFAADGTVISGPAPAPLDTFPLTFDGTAVTIDISGA